MVCCAMLTGYFIVIKKSNMNYEHFGTMEAVRKHIQDCEGRHTQQAIYSTFHDALTQVCYGCKKVRTTILISDLK